MAALNQVHANNILDASLGTAAFSATVGALHCRLMTANGTPTAAGTEVPSGGSYVAVTGITPVPFAAAATGSAANSSIVQQTNMPATTVVGIELWDSTGTPVRKWYGPLTASKTTNAGDTFSIAVGSLTAALS